MWQLSNCPYRSVPPVSVTSTISSRTARISLPLLVVSRRNSAKLGDMIKSSVVYVLPLIGIEPILTKNGTHQRGQEMRRELWKPFSYLIKSQKQDFYIIMKEVRIALFWWYHKETAKKMVWYAQEVLHLSSLCKELPHSITMLPYKVG